MDYRRTALRRPRQSGDRSDAIRRTPHRPSPSPCGLKNIRAPYQFHPQSAALSLNGASAIAKRPMLMRSEEHTSELQSLMRISYDVFCLKKKTTKKPIYRLE